MNELTKIKVNGDPESSYQLYPRNEEFSKRVELEIKEHVGSNGGDGVQSDWNVTDSADAAFIKNRPFGDIKGKEIFRNYAGSSNTQNADGDYVFTISTSQDCSLIVDNYSKASANVTIDGVTYENVQVNVKHYSMGSEYTFVTNGLPFSLSIAVSNDGSSTITFKYGQNYFSHLIIFDLNMIWESKMELRYLGINNNDAIEDKEHLNYSFANGCWEHSYDLYLKNTNGYVYKLNVDADGNLSTTKIT